MSPTKLQALPETLYEQVLLSLQSTKPVAEEMVPVQHIMSAQYFGLEEEKSPTFEALA
jgi:hypothetical protein